MTGEDVLGFAQGFMSGQRHMSDMESAKVARMRDLFNMAVDEQMQPLKLDAQRLQNLDARRLFNFNQQLDPYKLDEYKRQAQLVVEMWPQFKQRFGAQLTRDNTALNQEIFNIQATNVRTPDDMNALLASRKSNKRVASDGKGNMWYTDLNGKQVSPAVPADMFALSFGDPMKAAASATEHLFGIDSMQQEAAMRGAGAVGYPMPDVGMGEVAVPATPPGVAQQPLVRRDKGGSAPVAPTGGAQASGDSAVMDASVRANRPSWDTGSYKPSIPSYTAQQQVAEAEKARKIREFNDPARQSYYDAGEMGW